MKQLLLLCIFVLPQDVDDAIKKLGDADIAVRDEAARKIVDAGEKALPKLREALKTADGEAKARLQSLVDKIDRDGFLKKIKIEVELPKEAPTLKQVRGGNWQFTIKVSNENSEELVLWPYLSLVVLDKDGKEVRRSTNIGRWGMREKECFLECVPFLVLKSKAAETAQEGIASYMHEADAITGWKLPEAGDYTLRFTTSFKRDAFKARCKKCRTDHDGKDQPWNRALELERTFDVKLTVKE